MATTDPRIDDYIACAAEFARPILRELRARVHAACPEVVETIKWRVPTFEFAGMLGGMAAFKAHCLFGFWKDPLLRESGSAAVLDVLGKMTSVDDLPGKSVFAKVVKQAMALNATGAKVRRARPGVKAPIAAHPEFVRALAAAPKARKCFAAFPPGAQREYNEWIQDAKKDDTRARRIEQAVAWIAEGKRRNWKYERC
ncbi:MAG: YdeI/OmpD-associated family protein [Planctomycetes bacterium]|nr:YdeI/OmpD-associated family protein [Planctomycetota bacterium]